MKLSVVIVNYNVRAYLLQTVDSVIRACSGMDADVWVVDNASSDDSLACLQQLYPQVHIIANDSNVGFAKANNAAIRQSESDYVLLLNPDTIVGEDVLAQCAAFMDTHDEVGGIGVQMLNRDGSFAWESRRGVPTPATAFYKMCGLVRLFPNHPKFGHYHMRYLDRNEANQIEVISGAFMFLRRKALEQVGLLDEDFFMYGEDVDLSYRLLIGGWKNWYLPLRILHYKGESTQHTSFRYVRNFYMAMIIFYRKHFARTNRLTSFAVESAVYIIGAVSMTQKLIYRAGKSIGRMWKSLTMPKTRRREPRNPETMLFIGNHEGWEALQPVARRAKLAAIFYDIQTMPEEHLSADNCEVAFNYVVYQTETMSYAEMLSQRSRGYDEGIKAHLGTFSLRTKTLILPNDVFE